MSRTDAVRGRGRTDPDRGSGRPDDRDRGAANAATSAVPALAPERPIVFPERTRERLANGLDVVLVERHTIPKLGLELVVRSGNAAAPEKPGLAEMVVSVARTGTANRSSHQIEAELRRMGAELSTAAGMDTSTVEISGLTEFSRGLLELAADLAAHASFEPGEFARERRVMLETLRVERTTPAFRASERLRRELFGEHPYATLAPSDAVIEAYRVEDLETFYRAHYGASNAMLVAVGDFSAARLLEEIHAAFDGWRAAAEPAAANPPLPEGQGRRIHLVHMPGTVQTEVVVGNRAITRRHPDWLALILANAIFGGAFHSRLVANIREQKGYAYSVRSSLHPLRQHGYLNVRAAVRNEVVAATLAEIFYELDRFRALPPGEEELGEAQTYLSGIFSLALATQSGLLGQLLAVYLNDLPEDYLERYRERVRALTAEEVMRAARAYFDSPNALVVLAGDGEQIGKQAELFGPVATYDAAGNRIG
jgi:zinc protease